MPYVTSHKSDILHLYILHSMCVTRTTIKTYICIYIYMISRKDKINCDCLTVKYSTAEKRYLFYVNFICVDDNFLLY